MTKIRKLHDYQEKYIDNAINELMINNRCIIKSPTGSGKTLICFNIIANIYKKLSSKFKIFYQLNDVRDILECLKNNVNLKDS